jgi:hypothetical protein
MRSVLPPLVTSVQSPHVPSAGPKSIGVICMFPLAALAGSAGMTDVHARKTPSNAVSRLRVMNSFIESECMDDL